MNREWPRHPHPIAHQHTDPTAPGYVALGSSSAVRWWYRLHLYSAGGALLDDFAIEATSAADALDKGQKLLARIRASVHPRWTTFDAWEIVRVDQTESSIAGGGR